MGARCASTFQGKGDDLESDKCVEKRGDESDESPPSCRAVLPDVVFSLPRELSVSSMGFQLGRGSGAEVEAGDFNSAGNAFMFGFRNMVPHTSSQPWSKVAWMVSQTSSQPSFFNRFFLLPVLALCSMMLKNSVEGGGGCKLEGSAFMVSARTMCIHIGLVGHGH